MINLGQKIIQALLVLTNLVHIVLPLPSTSQCDIVKKEIETRFFSGMEYVETSSESICGQGSCCGPNMQKDMLKYSQSYVEKYVSDSALKVVSLIDTRAKKFDEIFKEMLNSSKREFHNMFERTYGKIYLQNSDVFSDFFNELETYYKKGTLRLAETMDTFFIILYQRLFTVLNRQYTFDDKYLECVADLMAETKPFGDVPHKLGQQLRRSFVATRTFYKALSKGGEVAKAMSKQRVDDECIEALTKMQFCGLCKGQTGNGACSRYCIDTLKICLRHHSQLNDEWDKYVDAIEKVAERLLGPYNIESVVEPLNIKISEAIMIFQDIGAQVTQKVYQRCGKPSASRPKRNADYEPTQADENSYGTVANVSKKKHKKPVPDSTESKFTLDKLITEIKTKIKDTKQFWLQLPYQYCNNQNVSVNSNVDCWNGSAIGVYDRNGTGIYDQQFNDSPTPSPIIVEQVFVLSGLTDKLRKAYQGMEVDFVDDSDETIAGSGSGSGDFEPNVDQEQPEEEEDIYGRHDGISFEEEEETRINVPERKPSTTTIMPGVFNNEVSSGGVVCHSGRWPIIFWLSAVIVARMV